MEFPESAHRPADLTYFTLRSVVSAASIDSRAPDKVLSLEFSLRLPETLSSSLGSTSTTDSNLSLGMAPSKAEEDIDLRLGGCSVSIISQTGVDKMRRRSQYHFITSIHSHAITNSGISAVYPIYYFQTH